MSKIIRLKHHKQLTDAQEAFHNVFHSPDPFDEPFQSKIEKRLILYPFQYVPNNKQYIAIEAAAESIGEKNAYISQIEGYKKGPFREGNHWQVRLSINPFKNGFNHEDGWTGLMETAIYSTHGSWGLISSHEWHAVVGGPNRFIETLAAKFPEVMTQTQNFLAAWKNNRDRYGVKIDWLPNLLAHLYGPETSHKLLMEAELA